MAVRYPREWLDDLRSRADIVKVVGSYVPLKKNGHRYVGLCPFHHETAPSFYVNEDRQTYYCFGCKAAGNAIQFVMEMEHFTFPEAVTYIADQVHLPLPEVRNDPDYENRRLEKERIYLANKAAAHYYHTLLWTEQGNEALEYLRNRGLNDSIIRRFGLGASPLSGGLTNELLKQGFTIEELLKAGLVIERENYRREMFRNRAMFPIIDSYGNVLGFGGRSLDNSQPKYLNTGETQAFNKRRHVYAENLLRKSKGLQRVILVEGYMDVVTLYQYGIDGVAATLGTAFTDEQARLMARFAPEIWLCYDGDKAGQNAILKGIDILRDAKVPAKILDIPNGMDPDEYIRNVSVEAFNDIKPIKPVVYKMLRLKEKFDLSLEENRVQYAKECSEILKDVSEPVELDSYIKRLSLETGIEKNVLLAQIGKSELSEKPDNEFKRQTFKKRNVSYDSDNRNARMLLAVLATGKLPKGSITTDMFEDSLLKEICNYMIKGYSAAEILEEMPDEESRSIIGEILDIDTNMEDRELMEMANDCLNKLHRAKLEDQLKTIKESLTNLQGEELERMTKVAVEITRRLSDLH